jgi:hypothetical protein
VKFLSALLVGVFLSAFSCAHAQLSPPVVYSGTSAGTLSTGPVLVLDQGNTAFFAATPSGSGPFSYQWKKDGMNLPAQTGSTLVLSNLKPEKIGYYTVTISKGADSISSTPVALRLNGIPFGAWQGLVTYYKFAGNAWDATGLGNDGTAVDVTGAPDRFGTPNQAFHFNGSSSYVGWPETVISPGIAGFTFSAWVNPEHATAPEGWVIMNHGAINGEACMSTTGTTCVFEVKLSDSHWYKTAWVPHALGLVHVVGVYERGTRLQLWLNGQLVSNSVPPSLDLFAAPNLPNPSSIGAGRDYYGVGATFPGTLDDVKIFNRALSAEDVQALYAADSTAPAPLPPSPAVGTIFSGTSSDTATTGTSITLTPGGSAYFSVAVPTSGTFNVQWKKDGMNLPAQTGSTLVLSNLKPANIGYYSAVISSGSATITSTPVALGLEEIPFGAWQGLGAFYQFSGDATDSSGWGNNGAAFNVTGTTDRFGTPNQAFHFNGSSSYVGWPDAVFGPQTNGFTFSVWVKSAQATPGETYIMNHGATNGEAGLTYTGSSYAFGVKLTDDQFHWITASHPLGLAHLTAVYERGKRQELWIDGELVASATPPNIDLHKDPFPDYPSSIGAYRCSWNFEKAFPGTIDDVKVFTRPLSANEVQTLHATEAPSVTPPPPAPGTVFSGSSADTATTGTSLTLNPGGSAYFSVAVPTSGTFNVQWKKDGASLPAQTGSTLALAHLKPANIGYYTAVISSGSATITSTPVALGLQNVPFGAWQGLAAYYQFSGDATDSSGLGNNGTAVNVTGATDRYGAPNQAFYFNGSSSYVGWPDAIISPQTAGFTMSMWVKPDYAKATGEWCVINHGAINGEGGLNTTGSTYEFQVKLSDASFCKTAWVPHSLGLVHLVGVYERGTRVQLWIDGELVSSSVPPSLGLFAAPNLPNPSSIGAARDMTGVGVAFPGVLDEVKIFNRALSASDVQALYTEESTGLVPLPPSPAPGTIFSGTSSDTATTGTSLTLNQGGSAYFSVAVPTSGTSYTVQWKKDGMNLPAQNGSTLVLTNLKPENIGYYTAVLYSGSTLISSTPVALGLNGIPFGAWQGLAAYYRFSGDASDSSGFGNDGTAVNVAGAADRYGMPNQAFHFDGSSSCVGWPDALFGPQINGFTFSVWVKSDQATPGETYIMNHGATNGEAGLTYTGSSYAFGVKLIDDQFHWITASHPLGLAHLTAVYERGKRQELWIDGKLVASATPPNIDLHKDPFPDYPSSIGAYRCSWNFEKAFPGTIDDVKVFTRPLSASDIQALFVQEASRGTGNTTSVVVVKDGTVPDLANSRFVAIGSPAMNNQLHVAFAATIAGPTPVTAKALSAGISGIWADDNSGVRHLVALAGRTAPGSNGAKFRELGDPVINNTEVVAFNATLAGAGVEPWNANGIWSTEGGTLHLIARQRQQAPGCGNGVVFQSFESFVLPDQGGSSNTGGVIVFAELAGPGVNLVNDKGIWAVATNGNLELIVREGDIHPITGKAIRKLSFLPRVTGLGAGQTRGYAQGTGDFLYKAEFADGSWGVYQSVFP